jgi:hypothetical protein
MVKEIVVDRGLFQSLSLFLGRIKWRKISRDSAHDIYKMVNGSKEEERR